VVVAGKAFSLPAVFVAIAGGLRRVSVFGGRRLRRREKPGWCCWPAMRARSLYRRTLTVKMPYRRSVVLMVSGREIGSCKGWVGLAWHFRLLRKSRLSRVLQITSSEHLQPLSLSVLEHRKHPYILRCWYTGLECNSDRWSKSAPPSHPRQG